MTDTPKFLAEVMPPTLTEEQKKEQARMEAITAAYELRKFFNVTEIDTFSSVGRGTTQLNG